MAFPSTQPLSVVLRDTLELAGHVKAFCVDRKAQLAASNQTSDYILDIHRRMTNADARLASAAAVSGIGEYAAEQTGVANIATEFTALRNAIQAVRDHVESAIPKDGSGYFLVNQFVNHVITPRQFTPANTATLRNLLQTVIDAVA
jgi:isoaspartyl peptidase/L-asparaginase-like protein (Ntn-hydrolase superfamily)